MATSPQFSIDDLVRAMRERGEELEVMRGIKAALTDVIGVLEGMPGEAERARMLADAVGSLKLPEPKVEMTGPSAEVLAEALTIAMSRAFQQIRLPVSPAPNVTVTPAPVTVQQPQARPLRIEITERAGPNADSPIKAMTITPL